MNQNLRPGVDPTLWIGVSVGLLLTFPFVALIVVAIKRLLGLLERR